MPYPDSDAEATALRAVGPAARVPVVRPPWRRVAVAKSHCRGRTSKSWCTRGNVLSDASCTRQAVGRASRASGPVRHRRPMCSPTGRSTFRVQQLPMQQVMFMQSHILRSNTVGELVDLHKHVPNSLFRAKRPGATTLCNDCVGSFTLNKQ